MASVASNVTKSYFAVNRMSGHAAKAQARASKKQGSESTPSAPVTSGNTAPTAAANPADEPDMMNPEDMAAMQKEMEASLPLLLDTAWSMCNVDITETVKASTKMVLKVVGVPWQIRMRRAYALRRLGRIFEDVAQGDHHEADATGEQVKRRLEEALLSSIKESKK